MFKQFFVGCVRRVAQLKQDGIMPIIEGKQAMSLKGYKFLALKAGGQSTDYSLAIFSHLYLVLCWNLIARCVSVGGLMYNHISWENDSMVTTVNRSKRCRTTLGHWSHREQSTGSRRISICAVELGGSESSGATRVRDTRVSEVLHYHFFVVLVLYT